MRILLELLRVYFILFFLGAIACRIIIDIYSKYGVGTSYSWFGIIAVFALIFVLYRNRLQFSGWYQGKGMQKLPKNLTRGIIIISILLLILPLLLN